MCRCMCRSPFTKKNANVFYKAQSQPFPVHVEGKHREICCNKGSNFKSVQQREDPFLKMSRTKRNSTIIFVCDY